MAAIDDLLAQKKLAATNTGAYQPNSMTTLSSGVAQPAPEQTTSPPPAAPAEDPNATQKFLQSYYEQQRGVPQAAPAMDPSQYTPQHAQGIQGTAQDNVDLEYNGRMRSLQLAADQAQRGNDQAINVQRNYGAQVDPRLQNIYQALQNSLGGIRDQNQQGYQSAIDKIRGYYDQAGQANQGMNQDVIARITADAQRNGVEAALPGGLGKMNDTFNFDQMQNNNAKAGRSANLAQLAAQIGGLDNQNIGSAAREGAQQRATLQNEVASTLGQLGVSGFNEQGKYRDQIQGLGQDKATALRQAIEQLTRERSGEGITARKDALQEFLAQSGNNRDQAGAMSQIFNQDRTFDRNTYEDNRDFGQGALQADRNYGLAKSQFGLSQEQFGNQVTQQNYDNSIQAQQLDLQRQALEQKAGTSGLNPLEEAQLAKIQAETAKITAGTSGVDGKYPPGTIGLNKWYSEPHPEFGYKTVPGPQTKAAVDAITQQAEQKAQLAATASGTKANPYQAALNLINSVNYGVNKDALRTAIQIYYQGVK